MGIRNNLYKGRFLIELRDDEDFIAGVFDNTREFAEYLGIEVNTAAKRLNKIVSGIHKRVDVDGKLYTVNLIDVSDSEN